MRIWISTVVCLVTLTMGSQCRPLDAQQRARDAASQRILPLPEGNLSNSQTQMLLLKRLRSLVTAADGSENTPPLAPENSSKIDDKQLEQLQQALKKLQDQLPPGMKPPELDSIPKEHLDEAMANPVVQQQLKKMLEQFSKDGLLPKNENTADNSPIPPIPAEKRRSDNSSRPESETETDRPTNPESTEPKQPPAEKSWQSLQDAMKKLSDIAQSGKNASPNSANGANGKVLSDNDEDPAARLAPDPQINRNNVPRGDRPSAKPAEKSPATNGSEKSNTYNNRPPSDGRNNRLPRDQNQQTDTGNEAEQGSLQAFQDLLERYQDSQRNQAPNGENDNISMQDDLTPPRIQPGMRPPVTRNVHDPPSTTLPKSTLSQSGNQGRTTPRIDQSTGRPSGTPAESSLDSESSLSVSEFLKKQIQRGLPIPNRDEIDPNRRIPSAETRPDAMPRGDVARSKQESTELLNQGMRPEQPGIDVRKELEQRGLRRTLEKIVQKAKEESSAQQRTQQEAIAGHLNANSPDVANKLTPNDTQGQSRSSAGPSMQKSLTDLLGGLDDNVQDIVKDAKFRDRPSNRQQGRDSAWRQSPPESESRLNKWNNAASGFLSDLSQAPQAPTSSQSPGGASSALSSEAPLAIGSIFLVGAVLLGLTVVFAYFMRQPLLKLVASATGIAGPNRVLPQGEIRSRADIIAAFHDLALSPKQLVESWWTHRAAAQKLAAESPQSKAAVDTLAEIYEQARYLPDDIELPPDSIQSARTALAACR